MGPLDPSAPPWATWPSRTQEELLFDGGWWHSFTPDGSRHDDSAAGVPFLCPSICSSALRCFRLEVMEGQVSLVAPDLAQVTRFATPDQIKANLAVGYVDGTEPKVDPALAREAAGLAGEGMLT